PLVMKNKPSITVATVSVTILTLSVFSACYQRTEPRERSIMTRPATPAQQVTPTEPPASSPLQSPEPGFTSPGGQLESLPKQSHTERSPEPDYTRAGTEFRMRASQPPTPPESRR